MASASVSFRISRSAEDLAGTLHLLSQRLIQLEQRLAALEARQVETVEEEDPVLLERLGNAERLLVDCRDLLAGALDAPLPVDAAEEASEATDPRIAAEVGSLATPSDPEEIDALAAPSDARALWEDEDEGDLDQELAA